MHKRSKWLNYNFGARIDLHPCLLREVSGLMDQEQGMTGRPSIGKGSKVNQRETAITNLGISLASGLWYSLNKWKHPVGPIRSSVESFSVLLVTVPSGRIGVSQALQRNQTFQRRQLIKREVMPSCPLPHFCFFFYLCEFEKDEGFSFFSSCLTSTKNSTS